MTTVDETLGFKIASNQLRFAPSGESAESWRRRCGWMTLEA